MEIRMLNKPSYNPLYKQVKAALLTRIALGDWPPGTFLPSESALAKDYGVSQGTLRKALNELTAENRVVRFQGKGTAVPTFDSDQHLYRFFQISRADGKLEFPVSQNLSTRTERPAKSVAAALGLAEGEMAFHLERVRVIGGVVVINERIYLPCSRFPGIEHYAPQSLPNTLYDFYQSKFQITIVQANEDLSAVTAEATDVKRLGVPLGHPLLAIRRLALDISGTLVELRLSRCNTAQHHYQIVLR
jgi:GntR family transcriptional regulator